MSEWIGLTEEFISYNDVEVPPAVVRRLSSNLELIELNGAVPTILLP